MWTTVAGRGRQQGHAWGPSAAKDRPRRRAPPERVPPLSKSRRQATDEWIRKAEGPCSMAPPITKGPTGSNCPLEMGRILSG